MTERTTLLADTALPRRAATTLPNEPKVGLAALTSIAPIIAWRALASAAGSFCDHALEPQPTQIARPQLLTVD
ncbi:hypothetical protein [Bradyrhizobium sp. USDA 4454]